MHTLTPTIKRIIALRARLLLDQPFFGVLALKLALLEDDTAKTAWTDGRSMGFNPTFVATLTDDALIGLIAHEVMHCACGHPWRRDARDVKQWNKACDYAINGILTDAHFTLPEGALLDPVYSGKNAEWIFDRLGPTPDPNGSSNAGAPGAPGTTPGSGQASGAASPGSGPSGSGAPAPGDFGEVRDAPGDCTSDGTSDSDWQQAVQQAKKAAGRGSASGSIAERIMEAAHVSVDWRSLLQRFITDTAAADYTWTRPNMRYLPNFILPSLRAPMCGPLVIAIDTSASIDSVLCGQFLDEVRELARTVQPSELHILQCDTRVHKHDCYERGEEIPALEIFGRGGTSFDPVFAAVDSLLAPPLALIYFTDLDGSFPDVAPDYPVLWLAYGCSDATMRGVPFGDVIPCE